MSRKAKAPIMIPKGVEIKIEGSKITVKGPKGTLNRELLAGICVVVEEGTLVVALDEKRPTTSNFLGLTWALLANMVQGVSAGYEKKLEMVGVGFRSIVQGTMVDLQVGFSHPTRLPIPQGIKVAVEKNTQITVSGIDKQEVGQFAADIRAVRKPEPYKGKGIRYAGEYVRKKAGKAGKK